MPEYLETPILFLTFNRLDTTKRVLGAIKEARPKKLYIASDGPRANVLGEDLKVKEVRDFIESNIDWECEVKTLFRDKNLGCKLAVSSAIDWFFENEEQGIILEDDCLPNQSFFQFCEELLEKYKDNEEIAVISGNNFNHDKIGNGDYYLSRIPHIWGWATWRRAWGGYDVTMAKFPGFKKNSAITKIWSNRKVQNYWIGILSEAYQGKIDTWDYQLTFSLFLNNSFCICPNVNLVSNIGFGKEFTNTIIDDKRVANLKLGKINFPLVYPMPLDYKEVNNKIINQVITKNYNLKNFLKMIGLFCFLKRIYKKFKK